MTMLDPINLNDARAALFAALAKAQALARSVEKDATNKFHKYGYTSAEGMIAEAKRALAECDLAVIPLSLIVRDPTQDERPLSDERGDVYKGARCVLVAAWIVAHKDGGHIDIACEWPVIPENGRPLDKALAAARTASLNYLLRDLLQLPRVEEGTDLDDDSRDRHREEERRGPPPKPPVTQAQRDTVKALNRALGFDSDTFIKMFGAPDSAERCAEIIAALEKLKREKEAQDKTLAVPPEAPAAASTGAGAQRSSETGTSGGNSPTATAPKTSVADSAVLDGPITSALVLVKRKIDLCSTAQAIAIAMAELTDTIEGLPKSPRMIARGYAAAVLKTLNGEALAEADAAAKKALDDLAES